MFDYSEDALVEQPAIELFVAMEWETVNGFHEFVRRAKAHQLLVQEK